MSGDEHEEIIKTKQIREYTCYIIVGSTCWNTLDIMFACVEYCGN